MFTQTMMQNLGAFKVGWVWLAMAVRRGIGGVRKFNQEK